jgi:dTDP-4-dehydrorhamnose reductase
MLGHKLWQVFAPRFETYVTFRGDVAGYSGYNIFDDSRALGGVHAENIESIGRTLAIVQPEVIVNCIGIVKQDAAAQDPVASITVNALFPHHVVRACSDRGIRLIHLSTDCVFSGRKGNYQEVDRPDAQDLYGRTKLLGEVTGANCLTIRTSMIGRELSGSQGLLEWFLSQAGHTVRGYRRAVFSGFTTGALAEVIAELITQYPDLTGMRHVAAEPINKFDLLSLIKRTYQLDIEIEPDEVFFCDRSLDAGRIRNETSIRVPSWPEMIERMRADSTPYDKIRRVHAAR